VYVAPAIHITDLAATELLLAPCSPLRGLASEGRTGVHPPAPQPSVLGSLGWAASQRWRRRAEGGAGVAVVTVVGGGRLLPFFVFVWALGSELLNSNSKHQTPNTKHRDGDHQLVLRGAVTVQFKKRSTHHEIRNSSCSLSLSLFVIRNTNPNPKTQAQAPNTPNNQQPTYNQQQQPTSTSTNHEPQAGGHDPRDLQPTVRGLQSGLQTHPAPPPPGPRTPRTGAST
jgi:hypothetical protein